MNLKEKFLNRERVSGAWTSFGHPSISEIFAQSGVDFIGIDIEHGTISQEQSRNIIAVCHANGVSCLPRIASHNMEMIKRLLDSGADGIIVPMVSTPEQVENLIRWSKYPPLGERSYGISRAQNYGFNFSNYVKTWNGASLLIIQIESIQGIENIDKLLKHDEVDGVMIGPYDLSGSLGIPGQLDHPQVLGATRRVIDSCKEHGKACGTQLIEPNEEAIQKALTQGYTFTVLASDVFVLWKWSAKMKELITHING